MDKTPPAVVPAFSSQIDIFLRPGEYFVGDESHRIRTLLGSCVSVTLWSPQRRVGAMSHFLLATRCHSGRPAAELDGRYGDEALHLMLGELARDDVRPAQCQAKIFGGGEMFSTRTSVGHKTIGRRNGEAAREMLQSRGIQVVSESLFGRGHRQIIFDVHSGNVWSRQISPKANAATLFASF
ncbi:chemotaxis protein CheD [Pelomonas cellulosilytica]|uniref:Probable chemoreceptor glutamine deamidase CheD n=1 Tax=Pelomonas cellulosilytica TaxID=2906762 RepID=A0ABS8Y3H3_9BURK|nr:chemotaxis protein CheD [Pelomonas sp. P8]MCE4557772.1 chemotaxis protein CheD [Pelomonas sp. P8]